uniref:Cytochrome c biogenesis protein CcsA n=2 Tax=Pavlovaceae TaxID=418969 RepID=M1K564_DIALT|nr:heme attachment to plastid cytochrome c [Diacronema lutheri]YP_009863771.1 heme attachment to plastid cytochrome c550 [Pavlova sp. NIVA-4/92]AGE93749.1 heme attachment to plastid cytochrome c [Diacronema lutheri]QKE31102.1 heme attachment to plastid cytochrome c550 [Pavlova sp. NIVA-4/92]|mmetsp:Transcript_5311/g.16678  ORF Transcript_5311/g.16678 Transcript_5311/m.16678 type:complete len:327 (-) Transcript_5311:3564-4544(-)
MNPLYTQNLAENFAFLCFMTGMIFSWISLVVFNSKYVIVIENASNILGCATLAYLLIYRWTTAHYFPISNLYESMLFLAWGLSFGSIVIKSSLKTRLIGATVTPIITSIVAFAGLVLPEDMQQPIALIPALKSNWLLMHVSVMMVSYATLLIGCLFAVAFLIMSQGKNIVLQGGSITNSWVKKDPINIVVNFQVEGKDEKITSDEIFNKDKKENSKDQKLLSLLESFDNISYRFIGLGFPFLTLGIISGAIWANQAWGSYWSWDPKETWSLIAWIVFAIYLHTRITKSWQGKRPAYIATLGFFTVWVCYLGVNFLGKGLHSYGWVL